VARSWSFWSTSLKGIKFPDKKITKWYTLYLHLHKQLVNEGDMNEGDVVQAVDLIATMGDICIQPGGAPHLHQEVRLLGMQSSFELALLI
jgi:murein DD-endopeptidase MepM/ murein hydrolase activator NlpD